MRSFLHRVYPASALVLALGLLGTPGSRAADGSATQQPDIDQLVAHLNSDDFDERNTATQKLAAMGETAREALEKAAAGTDAELRIAAADLLVKLGQTSLTLLTLNADGKPLSGAQGDLSITTPVDGSEVETIPLKITTREDGTVSVGKIEPGTYDLNVVWSRFSSANGSDRVGDRVQILPGANRVVMTLQSGGTVQGTALDADGKPLRDVKFSLGGQTQVTGADGKVRVDHVPLGTHPVSWSLDNQQPIEGPVVRSNEGKLTEIPPQKIAPKTLGGLKLTLQTAGGEAAAKHGVYVTLAPISPNPYVELQPLSTTFTGWLNNQFAPQHTDEKGVFSIDNLEPGKYRLLARGFETLPDHTLQYAPWVLPETANSFALYTADSVEIKSGPATELTVKPVAGGSVIGKIVDSRGEPISDAGVAILFERFATSAGLQTAVEVTPAEPYALSAHSGLDGTFEFKHVVPDTYVVSVIGTTGRTFVFNQTVTEGKTLDVGEIKLSDVKPGHAKLKGRVLLPDGKPCSDAELMLETAGPTGQSNESTNESGEFTFNQLESNTPGTPRRLKAMAQGYQPAWLDLTTPGLDLLRLEFRLKVQDYGGLRITTVDETGKPLPGVQVWPDNSNVESRLHLKTSDSKGKIAYTGLAAGPRVFKVEKYGYLAPAEVSATVVAGKDDTAVTVTLRPGLKVSGRVELPARVPTATAGIILTNLANSANTWTTVNSKGEFTFSGMTPGEYQATGIAGGCQLDGIPPRVTLSAEHAAPPLALKFTPHGAAAINVGPANSGRLVRVLPAEAFKHFDQFWYWYSVNSMQGVDSTGRVEFSDAPGEYIPFVIDEPPYDFADRAMLGLAAEPVTLQAVASIADVAGLPAKESKIVSGSGKISVAFVPDYPAGIPRENLIHDVEVILVGAQAMYTMTYLTTAAISPTIVGKPPADFTLERQSFTATKLPPGEYKLIVLLQDTRAQVIGQTVMATRTLKEGETLDLGELMLPIPKLAASTEAEDLDQPDVGKVEPFKP